MGWLRFVGCSNVKMSTLLESVEKGVDQVLLVEWLF